MIKWLRELFRHRTAVLVYEDGYEQVVHVTVTKPGYYVFDRDNLHVKLLPEGKVQYDPLGREGLAVGWFKHGNSWVGDEFPKTEEKEG